jgi:hypothetical protein
MASARELDGFHHLADVAVGQNVDRVAVFVGEFEGERGEVGHLLDGVGREDERAVAPVAAAFDDLDVIGLFRCDVAESGTAAHDVGDDAGKFRAGEIADAFLHEGDAGSAGCAHGADARGGGAVDHVDGGDFAFRLEEGAADERHVFRGRLGDLAGGGDRIAVVGPASGEDGGFDDGFVAFDQLFRHAALLRPGRALPRHRGGGWEPRAGGRP